MDFSSEFRQPSYFRETKPRLCGIESHSETMASKIKPEGPQVFGAMENLGYREARVPKAFRCYVALARISGHIRQLDHAGELRDPLS